MSEPDREELQSRPSHHPAKEFLSSFGKAELISLTVILVLCAFTRFYGLSDQGLRTSDGGHYAHQAWKVIRGQPNAIKDKPGHTLLLAIAFKLLGLRMSSALYLSASSGIVFVFILWLTVRHWYGTVAGLLTGLMAAVMPYFLFYHRSANSDANLLTCLIAGVSTFVFASGKLEQEEAGPGLTFGGMFGAGVLFGLALSINYSMAVVFIPVCVALAIRGGLNSHRILRFALGGVALVAGVAIGYAIPVVILWPYIEHEELWRQIGYHGGGILESSLSLRPFSMLASYAGVPALLLGGIGLWQMLKRRRPPDLLCLIMVAVMALAYFRAVLPYPRVYFPLCLPLLFGCGAAFEFVADALKDRKRLRAVVLVGALAVVIAFQIPEASGAVRLHSGYQETCDTLLSEGEGFQVGGTTHTWWTFEAFTGRRFGYCSDVLAEKFAAADYEAGLVKLFGNWYRKGFSHLVLDYFLWNRMDTKYNDRFAAFLEAHPPAHKIPNPVAGHRQTVAEDGELPEAGTNPLSEFIYIFRLKDFQEGQTSD